VPCGPRSPRAFVDLAALQDVFTRALRGGELARDLTEALPRAALERALTRRHPEIHHADHGVPDAVPGDVAVVQAAGLRAIMADRGQPLPDAFVERWMRPLKEEEVSLHDDRDRTQARVRIAHVLDDISMTKRLPPPTDLGHDTSRVVETLAFTTQVSSPVFRPFCAGIERRIEPAVLTETFLSLGKPKKEGKIVHRFLRFGAGCLLAVGLVVNVAATSPGDGTTAATAIPLPASLSAAATIGGSAGGAFVYYTFNSPGAASAANLSVTVTPANPVSAPWAGVNLYQAGSMIASVTGAKSAPPGATNSASFAVAAGPVLLQAYNYLSGQTSTIRFTISGLGPAAPVGSSAVASTPASPAPASPAACAPLPSAGGQTASTAVAFPSTLSVAGTLTGSAGGAYTYYTFNSPANGATGSVTLVVSPRDPVTDTNVGVSLWQGGSAIASINALGSTPGVNSAGFPLTTAGPVVVQVSNYGRGMPATYTVVISGTGITP
jgi:hypothetical protein